MDSKKKYNDLLTKIRSAISNDEIELNFSGLGIKILPLEISEFKQLRYLDISDNQIEKLPEGIGELNKLEELIIRGNNLKELPKSIKNLSSLVGLYASNNNFVKFPEDLDSLKSLRELELSYNKITEIPSKLVLPSLDFLAINGNKIYHFPKELLANNAINGLQLSNNPIYNIPLEIFNDDYDCLDEIRNYFDSIEKESVTRLYEVKLLVVGRGQVGKTCLSRKIMNPNYEVNFNENSTEGIQIRKWNLACPYDDGHKDIKINMWDFGGQEIYHATHQFFLTKRSIYFFVWDARQEEDYTSFDYWLNIISLLSNNSPIVIIQNKADERVKEIQQSLYKKKFSNIVGFHKTSCISGKGVNSLIEELKETISNLPHLGDELPKSWLELRKILENDDRDYIEYKEYLQICGKFGLDNKKAGYLSDYFHDLGIILHFRDDEILQDIVILKTEWGTDAVYKILDNKSITETNGRFTLRDVRGIWIEQKFQSKHLQLLQLMKKFELCFQLSNSKHYIAPALLPTEHPILEYFDEKNKTTNKYTWITNDNIIFEYHYNFMPAGVFTRFMVKMHNYIDRNFYWRNGVYLTYEQSNARVLNDPLRRKINIRLNGANPKQFLTIIRFYFNEIHRNLNNPNVKEMIPCSCSACIDNDPELIEHRAIIKARKMGITDIQCRKSFENVSVAKLINGIPEKIDKEAYGPKKYEIKIFEGNGKSEIEKLSSRVSDLAIGQEKILGSLSKKHKKIIQELQKEYDNKDIVLIKKMVEKISDTDQLKLSSVDRFRLEAIEQSVETIASKFGKIDHNLAMSKELLDDVKASVDIKGKLKLAVPIIPTILKYETEVSTDYKTVIAEIKSDFKKGDIFLKK